MLGTKGRVRRLHSNRLAACCRRIGVQIEVSAPACPCDCCVTKDGDVWDDPTRAFARFRSSRWKRQSHRAIAWMVMRFRADASRLRKLPGSSYVLGITPGSNSALACIGLGGWGRPEPGNRWPALLASAIRQSSLSIPLDRHDFITSPNRTRTPESHAFGCCCGLTKPARHVTGRLPSGLNNALCGGHCSQRDRDLGCESNIWSRPQSLDLGIAYTLSQICNDSR